MFLTVTLNPALDKTLEIDRNAPNATLRTRRPIDLAGGKGVNVARALLALGARARALMPLAGHNGARTEELARAEGMQVAAVRVPGETRLALTVREDASADYWHYLEPGPEFGADELEAVRTEYAAALEGCDTVIISGSLPCPEAAPLLPSMIGEAKARGLRVAFDSFGPLQEPALRAGPWLAKPNLFEWKSTFGEELSSEARRWAALERLLEWGVELPVLSLGGEGALAVAEGERLRILPPEVRLVNDLGGGDSMVAGICRAAAEGYSIRDCLVWGAACGAANAEVWDPGGIRRERVEELLPRVRIESVGRAERR